VDGGNIDGDNLVITFGHEALQMDVVKALTTVNRRGTMRIFEYDANSTTPRAIITGACILYPTAWPEENADFSKFDLELTFVEQPIIKLRQTVTT
jgi:hypothetical protein